MLKALHQSFSLSYSRGFSLNSVQLAQVTANPTSNLVTLRKSTGYPVNRCKEALTKFNGNIEEAAKYLDEQAQKEGWAKASKLKNRAMSQGTLAFVTNQLENQATLLELNCETDFVAKNAKFLELAAQITNSVLKNVKSTSSTHIFYKDELNKLNMANDPSKTIADQVALSIGMLGENLSVRRAAIYNLSPNNFYGWYVHGAEKSIIDGVHFGKYGALVNFSRTGQNENDKSKDFGRQVAQHIVGMKPTTLGNLADYTEKSSPVKEEKPKEVETVAAAAEKPAVTDPDQEEESLAPPPQAEDKETDARLLYQAFLMQPSLRVVDFLKENNAEVVDFVRFECGETIENDPNLIKKKED